MQDVFIIQIGDQTPEGFIVNSKEKSILEKQSAVKTPTELRELATVLELVPIEPKTVVVRKGSAETIFASQGAIPKKY